MTALATIVDHLDAHLRTREIPDFSPALNGLQVANRSAIRKVAAAVDLSRRAIEGAIREQANLLLVHHGMFWGGLQPVKGPFYDRLTLLFANDIAVYASHLPLDAHPTVGNNVLLARELGLEPDGGFATYQGIEIGVRGTTEIATRELAERARAFARKHGGDVLTSAVAEGRVTRRWALCTGAGASAETMREAVSLRVDTLIVGEGPHWTAVDAPEHGLAIIYAGHYATETLGVQALAAHVGETFDLPWTFVEAATGL